MSLKKISATIVADSVDKKNNRITSMIIEVPQMVVKELLRHRMFSFSSSSMRAVPFNKVLNDIRENMFIPHAFQRHHSGMQGSEYLIGEELDQAKNKWIEVGLNACKEAKELYNKGVTKQLCSRIIEPYGYAKILITATEFGNFFKLRCPKYTQHNINKNKTFYSKKDYEKEYGKQNLSELDWIKISKSDAEIHIQALAESIWDAMNESVPVELQEGEWHIPFSDKIDTNILSEMETDCKLNTHNDPEDVIIGIATARCARLSYMTFDGEIDYEKDIKLHDILLANGHASPFEHIARCMSDLEYYSFIKGKYPTTKDEWGIVNYERYPFKSKEMFPGEDYEFIGENPKNPNIYGWCNNFRGFIPYRYLIENC